MAAMPQRVVYDQLALLLVANTRKEQLVLVSISWVAFPVYMFYGGWIRIPGGWQFWIVLTLYLPALAIILRSDIESAISKLALTWTFKK